MKKLVTKVAELIVAEVAGADSWAIQKKQPVARTLEVKAPSLFIYGIEREVGQFRTTGSREDIFRVIIEYAEPAPEQERTFTRDETKELAIYELADSIVAWADGHEGGFLADDERFHRLDWIRTRYPARVRRQFPIRHCEITLEARKSSTYGG